MTCDCANILPWDAFMTRLVLPACRVRKIQSYILLPVIPCNWTPTTASRKEAANIIIFALNFPRASAEKLLHFASFARRYRLVVCWQFIVPRAYENCCFFPSPLLLLRSGTKTRWRKVVSRLNLNIDSFNRFGETKQLNIQGLENGSGWTCGWAEKRGAENLPSGGGLLPFQTRNYITQ